jgi:Domain of unknown function (DUF4292)
MYTKQLNIVFILTLLILSSCRPTKKIQTAIAKKDSVEIVSAKDPLADSIQFIQDTKKAMAQNQIHFNTFSAKIDVDYRDADDKNYNLNVFVRMRKDSIIWLKVDAIFGIEAMRAIITTDSVRLLDKQNKTLTLRSLAYLQEVAGIPFDLESLQNLIIGNPVFLDSNIVSYTKTGNSISLLSYGEFFKHLITLSDGDKLLLRSKLDDVDPLRNRTCDLTYNDYDDKHKINFATKRKVVIAEKSKLDIKMDFKQYSFNEMLTYPFSVPKNYKRK